MSGQRRWWTVSASATGSSHVTTGAPNQDALKVFETDDGVVMAVSDGHGGARYLRSAVGAGLAVEVAQRLGVEALRDRAPLRDSAAALPARIVAEWRRAVADHLRSQPLTPDERMLVGADPVVAYGATLMVTLFRSDEAVALQLGDGDVVVAWNDGRAARPVPPDPRNVAGQTTSLCLSDAAESFRTCSLAADGGLPHLVLVSTDGYGNSFADADWYVQVSRDLLRHLRVGGRQAVADGLPAWVAESARVGGDDTTTALAVAPEAGQLAPVATPVPTEVVRPPLSASTSAHPPPPKASPVISQGRRPVATIAGTAALAAVVGVIGGWLLGSGGNESAAESTVVTTVAVETTAVATTIVAPTTTASAPSSLAPTTDVELGLIVQAGGFLVTIDDVTGDQPRAVVAALDEAEVGGIPPIWTTLGRWWVDDGDLVLTGDDGDTSTIPTPSSTTVVGLGYSAGRVVAVTRPDDDMARLILMFRDAATGRQTAVIQVELPDEGPSVELPGNTTPPSEAITPVPPSNQTGSSP